MKAAVKWSSSPLSKLTGVSFACLTPDLPTLQSHRHMSWHKTVANYCGCPKFQTHVVALRQDAYFRTVERIGSCTSSGLLDTRPNNGALRINTCFRRCATLCPDGIIHFYDRNRGHSSTLLLRFQFAMVKALGPCQTDGLCNKLRYEYGGASLLRTGGCHKSRHAHVVGQTSSAVKLVAYP